MEAWVSNLNVNPERANPEHRGGQWVVKECSSQPLGGPGWARSCLFGSPPGWGALPQISSLGWRYAKTHRYQTVRPFTVLALSGLEHLWAHPPEVKRGAAHNRARNGSVCCTVLLPRSNTDRAACSEASGKFPPVQFLLLSTTQIQSLRPTWPALNWH